VDRLHFFRRHRRQVAAPFVGFEQDFVGDDVQLLLHFALHVFGVGRAEHFAQRAFADRVADGFAGARHHFDQQAQFGRDVVWRRCSSTRYCVRLTRFIVSLVDCN
jgi:hypothetical protein